MHENDIWQRHFKIMLSENLCLDQIQICQHSKLCNKQDLLTYLFKVEMLLFHY